MERRPRSIERAGITLVRGRVGEVGVGGYVLGGRLSFLSAKHGWAAHDIGDFELLLYNGTTLAASNRSHSGLFQTLKGGGYSFGVVTAYSMLAHPQGQVSIR